MDRFVGRDQDRMVECRVKLRYYGTPEQGIELLRRFSESAAFYFPSVEVDQIDTTEESATTFD